MTTPVTTEIVDGIGLIRIDNPPVNALSNAVRGGIADAVRVLEQDPDVQAMLILCAGKTFIAGADIREFGKPRQPPSLAETCDIIEGCTKPVVAALHGTALGGGFEIALAAHYRIAASDARMGLPEVKLGLIPGAGGANRLARIAGAEQALEIVIGGNPISAADAHAVGIVDEIAENDLRVAATAFAKSLAAGGKAARPTRARAIEAIAPDAFEAVVARLTRKTAGQEAPAACADSVRRAMTLPFDEAVARDREVFAQLSAGSQSRALRHVFFAEREAAKLASGSARPVTRTAVVGAGTMGGGIAMSFAAAGLPVTLIDIDDAAIERGMDRIRRNYATSVERGSISAAEADQRLVDAEQGPRLLTYAFGGLGAQCHVGAVADGPLDRPALPETSVQLDHLLSRPPLGGEQGGRQTERLGHRFGATRGGGGRVLDDPDPRGGVPASVGGDLADEGPVPQPLEGRGRGGPR